MNISKVNEFCALNQLIFVEELLKEGEKGYLFKDYKGKTVHITTKELSKKSKIISSVKH